ncbi:MAG: response regulator transcription factor [Spirochaetia bacterium]|nr:response regulator transcription factor [Spirochaetia bacterium]
MLSILVVDDDLHTRMLLTTILQKHGYGALEAGDGLEALKVLRANFVDLILLDQMLPRMNGLDFSNKLRSEHSMVPILMVTARGEKTSVKKGFISGIDDYMVKPVDEDELILRIKALLRRSRIASEACIKIGQVSLRYNSCEVEKDGVSTELPPKEFFLLYKLLSYPGQIFTRLQLLDEIWGLDSTSDASTINVHINRLRQRFAGWDEFEIVTVRGLGYKGVIHG